MVTYSVHVGPFVIYFVNGLLLVDLLCTFGDPLLPLFWHIIDTGAHFVLMYFVHGCSFGDVFYRCTTYWWPILYLPLAATSVFDMTLNHQIL